jgi:hypothetical protein
VDVIGHDMAAEKAILGCVLDHPTALDHLPIGAGNFHPKHQPILQALRAAIDVHDEPNLLMVGAELAKRDLLDKIGGPPYLLELVGQRCLPAQLSWHAQVVEAATVRRKAFEIGARVQQMANSNGDADDLLSSLADQAVALTELVDNGLASEGPMLSLSLLEDFVNEDIEPYSWVIPGLLEHGERFILTAPEGSGKSVLARQVAILVAGGRHPLLPKVEIPRKRTLIVDLENPPNLIRRHARGQVRAATVNGLDLGDRCWVWREPGGIDIRRDGMRAFERVLEQVQPDMVCMGPVYKLTVGQGTADGFEQQASGIQQALDRLRSKYGCAFWLEHHAGKGKEHNGKRTQDPYGSSFWLRWPEFGYGMSLADGCTDGSLWDLTRFRGDRDDRAWPERLMRTGNPAAPWGADWDDAEKKDALMRASDAT